MTVSTTSNRIVYTGNGTTTAFAFPYKFIATADLKVYVAGVLQSSGYTVGTPSDSGANVTFSSAPSNGAAIVILSDPARLQGTSLPSTGPFPAKSVETMADKLTLLVQRLYDLASRSLTLNDADSTTASTTLPTPAANQIIGWNGLGTGLQNVPLADLATSIAYGTARSDIFTGDGTTKTFTLSANPGAQANLDVAIAGVTQLPGTDYNWSTGTSLVFTSAPPNGAKILARYMQGLAQGASDSASAAFIQTGTGAVSRVAQDKLRETVSVKDFGAVGDGVTNDAAAINAAITAVIAAGGGTVVFPAGKFKCTSRIGTFVNANNVTLMGYGAEIQNFAGSNVQGLMQFGNAALDAYGMYSASAITVNNLKILGLKFTSSNVFNGAIPGRWSDQLPISINTAKDVLIRNCYFENWDFSAIDFGAMCKDALVEGCTFYSSQVEAGHANYGVRAFCYANYTNYSNGNGDLSPTDATTGVLKAGYAYISDNSTTWGHEGISVTNCFFENISHGVMLSAARRGIISNNRFVNCSTRSVSLTTYSRDYLCCNNTHVLDTTQQTSTGVSVFYGLGQATYRHQIQGDKFVVIGGTNNATGFGPIKCYINSHDWLIADCRFDIPAWAGSGGRCINLDDNSDGEIRNNHFKCPNVVHPVTTLSAFTVTSPGYQQGKIWVIGNIFEEFSTGAMEVRDTTSSPEAIVIKDNIVYGVPTRFVAANFSAAGKVAKLFLDGNKFLGSPVRYIDNIVTANKAIILNKDVLEIESFLSTGGGVANPSTTAVSFNFSAYQLPACFTSGTKRYLFSTYGGRENSQASTDFYFAITGETLNSISGNIVRNAGASFQTGYVGMKVIFEPYIT